MSVSANIRRSGLLLSILLTVPISALIGCRDQAPETVWSHSYAYEPIPIAPPMVDSVVAELAGNLNREAWPDPAVAERQIRQAMSLPDHVPPVSGGVLADDVASG